jgi:hypothetical protein
MESKVVLPKPTLMNHHNWNYEKIRFCILILEEECECHKKLVWPVPLAQVWTFYKIEKLNMWKLFCNVCIDFLNSQIWKEIMLEWYNWNGKPSSVPTFSTDFSFQNLIFWNLFEFSAAKVTLKSISPTFWIQILSNKFH